ncbi:MAG: malate dehydrogenase [candidate division Zixibacteria bacterium]|nr:malate dehydrogenase [candidate division Zixibacteria bacterium]
MNKKIAVIGAGNVGATCAMYLAEANMADVVLIDILKGVPDGKGLDLTQAGPVRGYNAMVKGSSRFSDLKGADIVIMTAGLARKPGMSREDLLAKNAAIIKSCGKEIKKYAPKSFVIVVSNPLDLMTFHMQKVTGFPKNRVFGQAGILDSTRFRAFISMELGVAMTDTQTMVLGGHGDTMVPLTKYTTVSGIPVGELIEKKKLDEMVERTRMGGGEIVKLLGTGSAYYAPAAASVDMCKAVFNDEKRVIAASAYLTGQFGIKDIYIGVPVIIGAKGVEKIIELKLSKSDLNALKGSASTYKKHLKELGYK